MAGRKEQDQDERRRAGSRTRAPPARARGFGTCSRVPPVLASVRKRLHCRKRAHGVGAGRAAGGPDGAWRSVSRVRGAGPQKMGRGARVVRPGRHAGSVRRAGEEHYAVSRDCGMPAIYETIHVRMEFNIFTSYKDIFYAILIAPCTQGTKHKGV